MFIVPRNTTMPVLGLLRVECEVDGQVVLSEEMRQSSPSYGGLTFDSGPQTIR